MDHSTELCESRGGAAAASESHVVSGRLSHWGWIQTLKIKPSAQPRSRQSRSSSCHQWPRTNALLPLDQGWVLQPSEYAGRSTTKHPLVPVPAIRAHLAPLLMIVFTSGPSQPDHRSRPGTKRLFVLEHRTVAQAKVGHARYPELDREHIALFAGWIVARSVADGHHHSVRKVSA